MRCAGGTAAQPGWDGPEGKAERGALAALRGGAVVAAARGSASRSIAPQLRLLYDHIVSIDLDRVREFLARKDERRRRELDERFARASSDFERIVRHIAAVYNPLRIYQWGSLLERAHFSGISDIDIAVEGLRGPEEYFAALGDAIRMTDFPVDLIEMEKIPAATAEHIRGTGRIVRERRQDP